MRDLVSCFSENAVDISHSSSSCSSYSKNACISPTLLTPSTQNSVSCVYKITLYTQKQLIITVTWCRTHSNQGFSLSFGDGGNPTTISSSSSSAAAAFRLNTNSRFFRKKKGSKFLESDDSKIEIIWDLSNAKYESGPEPVDGYSILVRIDSEIGLILGHVGEETVTTKKLKANPSIAKVSLISRREHCSGNTLYTTKAQFCETGSWHEIMIKCGGGQNEGLKCPVLSVCIDKKTVIRVKRLQWNFRGNQTIFVDGLLVDLLWDVHDWFFNPVSGSSAVFMFRTRSGMDSRLWLEEKMTQKEKDGVEFSLLIYACKST